MWVRRDAEFIQIPYLYRNRRRRNRTFVTWFWRPVDFHLSLFSYSQHNEKCRFRSYLYGFSVRRFRQISLIPLSPLDFQHSESMLVYPATFHSQDEYISDAPKFVNFVTRYYSPARLRKIGFEPTMFTTRDLIYSQVQHHRRCRFPKLCFTYLLFLQPSSFVQSSLYQIE